VAENPLTFFEYFGGTAALLPLGTWLYGRDARAAERCLETICKFRNMLEKFGQHLRNPSRHPDQDLRNLSELKSLLDELQRKKRGLLFKPYFLNSGIQESLKLFTKLDLPSPANEPHMIASEFMLEWGMSTASPYEAKRLIEIQRVLEKPSFLRWGLGIVSWMKPLWDKIRKIQFLIAIAIGLGLQLTKWPFYLELSSAMAIIGLEIALICLYEFFTRKRQDLAFLFLSLVFMWFGLAFFWLK